MDFETSKDTSHKLHQPAPPGMIPVFDSEIINDTAIPASERRTLIKSEEKGVQLDLGELWYSRELLYFLTLRDIKVRYKQTLMGVALGAHSAAVDSAHIHARL